MVRFARDCMAKMHELTQELAESLGEDTGMPRTYSVLLVKIAVNFS